MKARSFGNKKRGVSTLEVLIAFAIMTFTLTAVILVVFGNQFFSFDLQTNIEALSKAEAQLENIRALARNNFSGITPVAGTPEALPPYYQKSIEATYSPDGN